MAWRRRFLPHGVFWRQFVRWASLNVPVWLEPLVIDVWSFLFLAWAGGRNGVMTNLGHIKPGSLAFVNLFRTWRVFANFAWTISDTMHFKELRTEPDWEFVGTEHFEALCSRPGGAVILTAHMGSYDLGAHLFSEKSGRRIFMVRAPEVDPQTHQFEAEHQERTGSDALRIDFNTKASDLALDLLHAIHDGEFVAIQGDRVTPGISWMPGKLFGQKTRIPSGPFALAMASRVPIFPLFIVRRGKRRYRLITCKPIVVERHSRTRDDDLRQGVDLWCRELEAVIRDSWHQWFALYEFAEGPAE